jgi:hypothetical protein
VNARHHHELLTTEAGGMLLAFVVLLRPVAGAVRDAALRAIGRATTKTTGKDL